MCPQLPTLDDRACCQNLREISILGASMALINTLTSIGRRIWRTPPPPVELLEAYAHEVVPVLDRAEWLYQYWLEQSTLFTDGEKLGNVAAIHRWEIASMGRSLERVIPPSVLAGSHEDVLDALETASRATQLLSNGSRFHNANAVCEGLALLGVSRERRLAARRSIYQYLERIAPSAIAETVASTAEAAASAALAEVAARSAATTELPPAPETTSETAETAAMPPADDAASADASAPAPEPPGDSTAATSDANVSGAETALPPDFSTLDLVVTDTPEPAPAWLTTARDESESRTPVRELPPAPAEQAAPSQSTAAPGQQAAAASAPTTEPAPAPPPVVSTDPASPPAVSTDPVSPPVVSTDPASDRPADDEGDPPRSAGWGSLFGNRESGDRA